MALSDLPLPSLSTRLLSADRDAEFGKINVMVKKDADGSMKVSREPIPEMRTELKLIIEEMG